jgi:hypothetical protein
VQKIDGGYVLVSQKALSRLKAQISTRELTTNEARGILGLLEMRSIRKAAEALRGKNKKGRDLIPNYSAKELSKLTNLPFRIASKVLKIAHLSDFFSSEKGKLIPIPRRIIRFLAKGEKRSTILVLLTYLERGMSLDKGKIKNAGTVKASLISSQTGITLRSVRTARAELLDLGIITPDTTKYQRKLNRDGAYFTINLLWNDDKKTARVINSALSTGLLVVPSFAGPVDNSKQPVQKISLLLVQNSTKISPPYRDKLSSYEIRNQKTQSFASNTSGVFIKQERKSGGKGKVLLPPTIKNVLKADLENFGRCEELYFQATRKNLIEASEAGAINFLAAAVRAKSVSGDAPRIFMGIIRKKLWKNITQADENRALLALKRFRVDNPDRFRLAAIR